MLNLLGTAIPTPTGNGGCRDQGKPPATPRMCHPSPLQDHPRSIYLPSSIIPSGISPLSHSVRKSPNQEHPPQAAACGNHLTKNTRLKPQRTEGNLPTRRLPNPTTRKKISRPGAPPKPLLTKSLLLHATPHWILFNEFVVCVAGDFQFAAYAGDGVPFGEKFLYQRDIGFQILELYAGAFTAA